jgi:hypothetical protein
MAGAAFWIFAKWASFATVALVSGARAVDVLSFLDYNRVSTEAIALSLGEPNTPPLLVTGALGKWGYLRDALHMAAFTAGGLATHGLLAEADACLTCGKYASIERVFPAVRRADFDRWVDVAELALPRLDDSVRSALGKRAPHRFELQLARCPSCGAEWVRPIAVVDRVDDSVLTKLGRYPIDGATAARLREHAPRRA